MVETDVSDKRAGERIAKVMARAGLCSRREAETWIAAGRVKLNGRPLTTPATLVSDKDEIIVDGNPLPTREPTRLWMYHKPRGLVTSTRDERDRPTVFSKLPEALPRVVSIGRLDINTEGLLLLTNDGGLARVLELPETGWTRRYRVRAFGSLVKADIERLASGMTVDGTRYGPVDATLDRGKLAAGAANLWLTLSLKEGKNREIKVLLDALGLKVSRLIRLSYGPFQLGDLTTGGVEEVKSRILKDQLGQALIQKAGAIFIDHRRDRRPAGSNKDPSAKTPRPRAKKSATERPHAHRRRK